MIIHLFNSSSVSGPERLVLPPLSALRERFMIVNLLEDRIPYLGILDPLGEYCRSLQLPYEAVHVNGRWDRSAMGALRALWARKNPELIHAHDVKASVYLRLSQTRRHIPLVSTHHGVHGRPGLVTRLYEWIYRRFFLNTFDRVLCVSSADHAFLLASGIDKSRLRLHLNGAAGRRVLPENRARESERIRALWLPEAPQRDRLFLFGAVGRLSAEKDHARLFKILARLDPTPGVDWRCLIFGVGPLDEALRGLAQRLGLEKRILWMGFRKEAGAELAGLDLLLSFSKAEGLPISLIEAGWAGTPVMATQVGGVKDLIPDENYGVPVPAGEPAAQSTRRLRELLSPEGAALLRAQGNAFQGRVSDNFTGELWVARLKTIYRELKVELARPASRGPVFSGLWGGLIATPN